MICFHATFELVLRLTCATARRLYTPQQLLRVPPVGSVNSNSSTRKNPQRPVQLSPVSPMQDCWSEGFPNLQGERPGDAAAVLNQASASHVSEGSPCLARTSVGEVRRCVVSLSWERSYSPSARRQLHVSAAWRSNRSALPPPPQPR